MKKFINIAILTAGVFLLSGCGGGGGSSTADSTQTTTQKETKSIEMIEGVSYEVHKGDKVIKNSPATIVILETDLKSNKTVVTLESGSATLSTKY